MEGQNRFKTLLVQISLIFLPVLSIMVGIIYNTVYNSTVDGFLKAQDSHMEMIMDQAYNEYHAVAFYNSDATDWFINMWEKYPSDAVTSMGASDYKALKKYTDEHPDFDLGNPECRENLPEDICRIYAKKTYVDMTACYSYFLRDDSITAAFLVDLKQENKIIFLSEFRVDGKQHKLGDTYEYDISDHPAIAEMLENGEDEVYFEKQEGISSEGKYYIAYKPVLADGKVRAALGIAYKWDIIQSTATESLLKTLVISIGGIIVALVVLLIVLYFFSIRPVKKLQNALVSYNEDKNSTELVAKMLDIRSGNEFSYLADTMADFVMKINHYTEENIRIATEREKAEKELYEAKVNIMVSQVRPHFIYNALTSIAMMCTIDPDTAQEATIEFADYLRGNMDSLKNTAPVPFSHELEHLKKYLYIEKLRFADKLNIVYDIGPTEFNLPQLSIQPLVENAVKHGVGMKLEGGTVTISTKETETAFEVCITDDGVGFDVEKVKDKKDGRSHIGMENTKKRLKDMCDAEITITSTPGEGTVARVVLPKEGQKSDNTVRG